MQICAGKKKISFGSQEPILSSPSNHNSLKFNLKWNIKFMNYTCMLAWLTRKKSSSMGCVILLSTTVPGGTLWFFPSSSSLFVGKNLVWCRFCTTRNVTMGVYSWFNELHARLIAFTSLFKTYNRKCNDNTRKSIIQISVQENDCCVEQEISNFRNTFLGFFLFLQLAHQSFSIYPSTHVWKNLRTAHIFSN